MTFAERKTPARLASPAARKLPRKILFWVMIAYIIAGLYGRDPWKTDDLVGIATMMSALEENHWLSTYIGVLPYPELGPLTHIIGGVFIYLFSPLFEFFVSPAQAHILAARLPNFFYFFSMLWGVWYGTYLLARRPEAQPLHLPFGGEPNPRDYGRMIADVALLFLLASVGIVIRLHETSYFPLLMAIYGVAFYGFVRFLDHPTQGSLVLGTMLVAAFMTRGVVGVTPLLLVSLSLFITRIYNLRLKVFLFISLLLATLLSVVWLASTYNIDPEWVVNWWDYQRQLFSLSHWLETPKNLRDLSWFLWPCWPFALLALWNWRQWFDTPHIFIPTSFVIANLLVIFTTARAFEPEYAPLTIAFAILAALAIPTLKRSLINLLDWYSIMVVSFALIAIWVGWVALHFGIPQQIHHNIMRLIPGFDTRILWINVIAGIIICIFWYRLVAWRIKSNPKAMWRGLTLAAAGTTITWFLLSALWLPAINYNRSYRTVGESFAQLKLPTQTCIRGENLGEGQRAAFYLFGNVHFSQDEACRYMLLQTNKESLLNSSFKNPSIIWQGQRDSERHGETFLLIDLKTQK
ncbi:hypothetical protein F9B74_01800 [Pelistega sp. NLN82]|uniref:4-amino-4-deoxy-L-arabinose transferase-like glycosyltransferase n=1 Tax=Pelistega ratti TaxID=2652177 RepID=A0A6L9Y3P9_9BURK|nr:hypothetical protein [Pelistega ratti]NEN75060.1 hypothetical protein [Pelistega ratti]